MQRDLHRAASPIDFPRQRLEGHRCIYTCLNFLFSLFTLVFLFQPLAPRVAPPRIPSCIKKLLIDNLCGGALSIPLVHPTNVFLNAFRFHPQGYFCYVGPAGFGIKENLQSYILKFIRVIYGEVAYLG